MAFILVVVAVKAVKDNPNFLNDWKKKLLPNGQPSLLKSSVRSESEVKGVLEVTVKSVLGSDGRPMDGARPTDGVELEEWEIDNENENLAPKMLALKDEAADAATGSVDKPRVIRFSIFDDQPDNMQLYLSVRRREDPPGKSHLALASIPIWTAVARGSDQRTVPLVLERGLKVGDPSKVIGSVKVGLQYVHKRVDPYDTYGSYSRSGSVQPVDSYEWGSSSGNGSSASGIKKKGWGLGKMSASLQRLNFRKKGELLEDDDLAESDEYSAYL